MTVARLAISLDADLARAVRRAARGTATSTWLAEAARQRLRSEGLGRAIDAWERAHGALSDDEVRAAGRKQARAVAAARRRARRRGASR